MPRPDEGLIHAWLDGQLPPDEAARIEALVATDPEWASAVAEARGFVAASSRILSALDRVPAGVVPKGTSVHTAQRLPWWTKIAAAVVVVVGGSVVVLQRVPDGRLPVRSTEQGSVQPTSSAPTAIAAVSDAVAPTPATPPTANARRSVDSSISGAPSGAGVRARDTRESRREALATQPVTPRVAPFPLVTATVAEERKAEQDVKRVVAEVSEAQPPVPKAAPNAVPSVASGIAPSTALQTQQASVQGFTQAQHTAPAQRVVAGVTAQKATAPQASLCYRLVPDSLRAGAAVIMRTVRADGDTLRLVPVEPSMSQRAWIVLGDGMKGVMTTSGELRSAVRVVATPTACPAP